jgi:hypothetical protein
MRELALVLLVALTGCGPGGTTPAPLAECREEGVQCQLPEGPLGVCERSQCEPGHAPPCYRCIAQH